MPPGQIRVPRPAVSPGVDAASLAQQVGRSRRKRRGVDPAILYPGAKGHLNEQGPKEILGKVTISPKVRRQIRKMMAHR